MERRNLEGVEHVRQWLSANQRRKGTVNQYACNSLRQMTVALLENGGFPHVSFTRTCKHSKDRSILSRKLSISCRVLPEAP